MKIIKKGTTPGGTPIQIEDWHMSYSFMAEASTLAAYPLSNKTKEGTYAPKAGEKYRFQFNFEDAEECQKAFTALEQGASLSEYADKMQNPIYVDCL